MIASPINICVMSGTVMNTPEAKKLPKGCHCMFKLNAPEYTEKNETHRIYIMVQCFSPIAEFVAKNITAGMKVVVTGKLCTYKGLSGTYPYILASGIDMSLTPKQKMAYTTEEMDNQSF